MEIAVAVLVAVIVGLAIRWIVPRWRARSPEAEVAAQAFARERDAERTVAMERVDRTDKWPLI